jgi:hypothetical protein
VGGTAAPCDDADGAAGQWQRRLALSAFNLASPSAGRVVRCPSFPPTARLKGRIQNTDARRWTVPNRPRVPPPNGSRTGPRTVPPRSACVRGYPCASVFSLASPSAGRTVRCPPSSPTERSKGRMQDTNAHGYPQMHADRPCLTGRPRHRTTFSGQGPERRHADAGTGRPWVARSRRAMTGRGGESVPTRVALARPRVRSSG